MKKLKIIIFTTFIIISAACEKKHNGVLSLEIENGVGATKNVNFNVSESTIQEYENLKNKNTKELEQLIKQSLSYAKGYLGVTLNNPSSYDFIDDSIGEVYLESDTTYISYNFTAQNGFGNNIINKAYIKVYSENGENKTDIKIE